MKTHNLVLSSFFIALGIILPVVFHMFGGAGNVFLPMHIPVLLAGFFMGKNYGFVVGIITPILSCAFTGMPSLLPMLPIMLFELGTYGYVSGYLHRTKELNVSPALFVTMLCGRAAAALAVFILVKIIHIPSFSIGPLTYFGGLFITGLPGMIIQIIFIPFLLKRLHNGYLKYKTKSNLK